MRSRSWSNDFIEMLYPTTHYWSNIILLLLILPSSTRQNVLRSITLQAEHIQLLGVNIFVVLPIFSWQREWNTRYWVETFISCFFVCLSCALMQPTWNEILYSTSISFYGPWKEVFVTTKRSYGDFQKHFCMIKEWV